MSVVTEGTRSSWNQNSLLDSMRQLRDFAGFAAITESCSTHSEIPPHQIGEGLSGNRKSDLPHLHIVARSGRTLAQMYVRPGQNAPPHLQVCLHLPI